MDTQATLTPERQRSPHRAPGAAGAPFQRAPYFLLRSNPVPVSAVLFPGRDAVTGTLAQLCALDRADAEDRGELCDVLYEAAGRADRDLRYDVLLPLRRALHNDRELPVAYDDVAPAVADERLRRWYERAARRRTLCEQLEQDHGARLHAEREHLRRQLEHPELLRSLALSSAQLLGLAEQYRARPFEQLRKKARKDEATLLKYVSRAAAKTSPMSRYTAVALGSWQGPTDLDATRGPWVSVVEPNHLLVRRLLDAASADGDFRRALRYRLAPTLRTLDGEAVVEVDVDDPAAHPRVFAATQREVRVRFDGVLAALASRFGAIGNAPLPFRQLAREIAAAARGATLEMVEDLLDRLVAAGVLDPYPLVGEQVTGIAGETARALDELDAPLARELLPSFERLAGLVEGWGEEAAGDRRERLRAVEGCWRDAYAAVGQPVPAVPAVFEDAVCRAPVQIDPRDWQPLLDGCLRTLGVLEAFDEHHVATRLVRNRFVQRYGAGGRCDDLDDFVGQLRAIYEATYGITEGTDSQLPDDDPELAGFLALREEVMQGCLAGIAAGSDPVELEPRLVAEVQARLPRWVTAEPASYTLFLQARRDHRGAAPPEATVNKIYSGWGQYLSRFLHGQPDGALQSVRGHLRRTFPDGDVVAELRPVFGFNANLHPLLAEVDVDWQQLGGPGAITPRDLRLEHDEALDRVVLRQAGTGRRVHVLYLGFLVPYVLPARLSALFTFDGSGQVAFDPHGLSELRRPAGERGSVRAYPRIRCGPLVLVRRRWHVPVGLFPLPDPGEGAAAYFVRLNRWRTAHGIPEQVFVHPPLPEWGASTSDAYYASFFANRKPQFVDLASPLFAQHLPRLLRDIPEQVVVEEVSPPLEDAHLRHPDGAHVAEVLVEIARRGRAAA